MISLIMWAESNAEGGPLNSRGWKVRKQVCYKNYTSSLFSHLHTRAQTAARVDSRHASSNAQTRTKHMHVCTHPPLHRHTNHRVNSCSLTSRCCQHDGGEEKRRSKENGERNESRGEDVGAAVCSVEDLLAVCSLVCTTKSSPPVL